VHRRMFSLVFWTALALIRGCSVRAPGFQGPCGAASFCTPSFLSPPSIQSVQPPGKRFDAYHLLSRKLLGNRSVKKEWLRTTGTGLSAHSPGGTAVLSQDPSCSHEGHSDGAAHGFLVEAPLIAPADGGKNRHPQGPKEDAHLGLTVTVPKLHGQGPVGQQRKIREPAAFVLEEQLCVPPQEIPHPLVLIIVRKRCSPTSSLRSQTFAWLSPMKGDRRIHFRTEDRNINYPPEFLYPPAVFHLLAVCGADVFRQHWSAP